MCGPARRRTVRFLLSYPFSEIREGCQSVAWLNCSTLVKLPVASAVIALSVSKVIHRHKLVTVPMWHSEKSPGMTAGTDAQLV